MASVQACLSAQLPMRTMRRVSSAIGMNSEGGIMPRLGCFQRISASKLDTLPSRRSTIGW